jgi:translocation and assembly module TamB
MRRRLAIAAALLAALTLGVVWLARSQAAFAFLTERVARLSGGRVAIEGAGGSLLGPLHAERVIVKSGGTRSVAERVSLTPRWRALALGELAFDALTIETLQIEPGPPQDEPPRVPASLAPPLTISVERIEIAKLRIGERTQLAEIRARARLGRDAHDVAITRLVSPWGGLAGSVRIETVQPFALSGEIAIARNAPPRARAKLTASGSLTRALVALTGSLGEAPLTGRLEFAAFERPWLGALALRGEHVDTAAFVANPGAPHSDLAVRVDARGAPDALLAGRLRATNAAAGPLSRRALPLASLAAELRFAAGALEFSDVDARIGADGAARGRARLQGGALALELALQRLDLLALHERLRATRLAGELEASISAQRIAGSLALREAGRELRGRFLREGRALRAEDVRIAVGGGEIEGAGEWDGAAAFSARVRFAAFDPAALGDFPSASLSGSLDANGELGEIWRARLVYDLSGSRYRGHALSGRGALTLAENRITQADAQLRLAANRLHARGAFGAPGDALSLRVDAPDLSALGESFRGRLALELTLRGTRARPGGALVASARELRVQGGVAFGELAARASLGTDRERALSAEASAQRFALAGARFDDASLSATGTLAAHALAFGANGAELGSVRAELAGGWDGAWSGRATRVESSGRVALALQEPAPLRIAPPGSVRFGPARFAALGGEIALGAFELENRRIESSGVASEISARELLLALGRDASNAGDLRVRGVWVIPRDPAQLGQLRLELAGGDAQLGGAALGLRELQVDAALGERLARVNARLEGERLGRAELRAELAAAPNHALLARSSALDANLAADLASLRALGGLLGISARVEGRAQLALHATGSVGAPRYAGTIAGEGLRFDWPSAGVALRDGELRARLAPDELFVENLSFAAAKGEIRAHGSAPLDGSPATLTWEADRLRVLDRPDRNLEVTGKGTASLGMRRLALRGELRANRGYLEVPRVQQAKLGDDVVVLGSARPEQNGDAARLELDLALDAGKDLRIVGAGLDTYLRGELRVQTQPDGKLVAFGEIDARRGTYRAFGQKLEIERGSLIFDGPVDDPALDVLALRKNLPVEAGVELTGTLKTPLARLVSNPPVPDSEKLSWLVLGHGVSDASAADTALLQAAAASLFGGDGAVPIGQRIARGVGLDEISLRSTGDQATSEAAGRAVALGKRLTDKLYLEYEYGFEAASHLVRLHYLLTRALSVRAETSGATSNVGLNFRKSWD